ncbi:ABC transporter permease [Salisediminibacterium selenitireducens]|uniref:ABC-type Na+ efflux pump permease component-like protein n=1 Tax=Bacillus selenitireducens (strain ATCC 700615 / DSM 15326 / MLS10) TaxID=439292 RepID=D6XUN1_BACIE|nr:ABC transporter permease [Salisediminibacterium selenitireducens]ADH99517.1 ABC-type Na+ efflux pump permease component-like protein [[Bacillus] selenitireducens MLS10]
MHNFWTTFNHTAMQRIKSKSFIITTLIMMIGIIAGFTAVGYFIDRDTAGEPNGEEMPQEVIYVVDESLDEDGEQSETLAMMLTEMTGYFSYESEPGLSLDNAMDKVSEEEDEETGTPEGVLHIQGDAADLEVTFFGEGADFRIAQNVQQDLNQARDMYVMSQLSLSEREEAILTGAIQFEEEALPEAAGEIQTMDSYMQSYWMVYVLVFAIYMIVILFGSMIATEIATEKSSRVMELIVSSINPVTQMFGKLAGIGFAGIINIGAIIGAAITGVYLSGQDEIQTFLTEMIDYSLLGYAILMIVLGYLLYGGLSAMLGALVSRAEEVNQAIQPLIFLAMIAFFVSIFGLNAPEATFIQWLSYIPFFTPQLLFLRIGMTPIPGWEIALITGILILSAIVANVIAARIYKGGVLMYGKFSFKEGIRQALTLSQKEK